MSGPSEAFRKRTFVHLQPLRRLLRVQRLRADERRARVSRAVLFEEEVVHSVARNEVPTCKGR